VLSSGQGADLAYILNAFSEAGYSLWWQVLNAKDFGVPQNRERIFVVGTRADLDSPREVFFVREDDNVSVESDGADEGPTQTEVSHALRGSSVKADQVFIKTLTPAGTSDAFRVYDTTGLSKTLSANGGGTGAKSGLIVDHEEPKLTNHSNAIDANYHKGFDNHGQRTGVFDGRIRRLTPIECERLMSWPDDWTQIGNYGAGAVSISDTQRYKMAGNGVVSRVVEAIVKAHLL
jgi:DNA (cytosine-5)-methyltransferase 1